MMVRIEDNTIRHPRDARLNLLLSCGAGREGPALEQLPRLLSPMGIYHIKVTSGESAARVICEFPIHNAVTSLRLGRRDEWICTSDPL